MSCNLKYVEIRLWSIDRRLRRFRDKEDDKSKAAIINEIITDLREDILNVGQIGAALEEEEICEEEICSET